LGLLIFFSSNNCKVGIMPVHAGNVSFA
jgi:hypothetical protein